MTELEPAPGYSIKEPATQECFISGGESKVLTFENTPLSAIIIRKVDSETGQPLEVHGSVSVILAALLVRAGQSSVSTVPLVMAPLS